MRWGVEVVNASPFWHTLSDIDLIEMHEAHKLWNSIVALNVHLPKGIYHHWYMLFKSMYTLHLIDDVEYDRIALSHEVEMKVLNTRGIYEACYRGDEGKRVLVPTTKTLPNKGCRGRSGAC